MKIIIVTGKSGAGKSVVSKMLASEFDAKLVCLDEISHLSLEDAEIKQKLTLKFGNSILSNGKIDRKKLGRLAFNDEEKLEYLNNLSWKFIDTYVDEIIKNSNSNYLILEYLLLPKMKFFKIADYKILVHSNTEKRFERLAFRDGVSLDYLSLREKNSPEFNPSDYDYVIDNSNLTESELQDEARKIAKKIQI